MQYQCMNGSSGTSRHAEYTEALFRVHTEESFTESTWCAACLTEYVVDSGMGACVQYVGLLKPVKTAAEEEDLQKVLALGFSVEQP